MNLRSPFQYVHAFFRSNNRIAVEIGCALFKFRKVLDRLQRPLRSKQALNIYPAQRSSFNPAPVFLRANVTHQMEGPGSMTVDMTIEASHAQHTIRPLCLAIISHVELLLRKLSQQQAQAFELLGIENAVE